MANDIDDKEIKKNEPKFNVIYCKDPTPDNLKAEKYIKFLKHLVKVVKEQEALSKKRQKERINHD